MCVCGNFKEFAQWPKTTIDTEECAPYCNAHAQMAELVDAPASGAGTRKGVEVRVLFWAPLNLFKCLFLLMKTEQRAQHSHFCSHSEFSSLDQGSGELAITANSHLESS